MRTLGMRTVVFALCGLIFAFAAHGQGRNVSGSAGARCRQVVLAGQVAQGAEWHASLGRDANGAEWVIRLVPVKGLGGTSGWDLAASPAADQNYPDGLLLASPPYGSLNSREIATTYGLRAQDAVAWTPRHFHLLTSTGALREARPLYHTLMDPAASAAAREQASRQMLDLTGAPGKSASGRLQVVDAHLVAGSADAAPYAAQWAQGFDGVPHTLDPDGGRATPKGDLHGVSFRVSLWLPISWNAPKGEGIVPVACSE